jgi:hypothetical protein
MPLETAPLTPRQRLAAGPAAYSEDTVATLVGAGGRFGAGYVTENDVASWSRDQEFLTEEEAVEGYDQYRDIPEDLSGLPDDTWDAVDSPAAMAGRIGDVRQELETAKINAEGGFINFLGQLSGFITSPEQVVGMAALPVRGATFLSSAAKSAALIAPLEIGHELAMHDTQSLRTLQQSAVNVSASVVLGGLIGGAFGKKLANDITGTVQRDIDEAVKNYGMKSVGAAEVSGVPTPEGELIVNPPWLKWGVLGPGRSLAATDNPESARAFNNFWEHGYTTGKTKDGHAQQIALETEVSQETANYIRISNVAINDGYKKYVGATGNIDLAKGLVKNRGQRGKYERDVHRAMVNEDKLPADYVGDLGQSQIKAVEETARTLRSQIYDKTLAVAKEADLLDPEEFSVKFAKSYAPRRWNKRAVRANRVLFKESLENKYIELRPARLFAEAKVAHAAKYAKQAKGAKAKGKPVPVEKEFTQTIEDFTDVPLSHGEEVRMNDSINSTYDRIVYSYDQDVFMGGGARTGLGSPFKSRAVPLDDNFLMDNHWLESSLDSMTMNHVNKVVKPARMALKNEGDPEMENVFKEIDRSFNDSIDALEKIDPKAASKMERHKINELEMHRLLRDRWYGRKVIPTTRAGAAINDVFRGFRNLNTSLLMGMVLPTSAGDVSRWNIATLYKPELASAGPKLVHALKTANLNKEQYVKLAIAHETETRIRQAKIFDGTELTDVHGAYPATDMWVKGTGMLSKGLMSATHLAPYTDLGKTMAAAYVQNDLVHSLVNYAKLSAKNKMHLARLGFNAGDAKLLQAEIKRSLKLADTDKSIQQIGMQDVGLDGSATVINYENFASRKLAKKFGTILFRESERSMVTPTTIDMPMWLGDSEAGKSVAQFTSFAFGAVNQIGVPVGKRINALRYGSDVDAKAYMMTGQLVGGGLLAVVLRNAINGRLDEMEDWTPMDYALNSVDYSGAVPLVMMAFNGVNMLSQNSLVNALGATTMARTAQRPISSVAGPTAGVIENAIRTTQNIAEFDEWTESEIRTAKRLIPWYKLMYFNAARTLKESTE